MERNEQKNPADVKVEARQKYEMLARKHRLIKRHIAKVNDYRYTPLTENGITLLEQAAQTLFKRMKELEPLL